MSANNNETDYEENQKISIEQITKKVLKISKGNSYYLLDRYQYDVNSIMMLLDLNKINKLGDIFIDYPEGIEKLDFIKKMHLELHVDSSGLMGGTNLVYGLYKFFKEIDFNGDGHMQWEEFTQFIIDTVEGDNDAKVDEKEDDKNSKAFNEKQMVRYKRYQISNRIKDSNIHKKDIISAAFIPRLDMLLICEYGSKIVKIYNPKTGKHEKTFDIEAFLNGIITSNKKTDLTLSSINKPKKGKDGNKKQPNATFSVLSLTQNVLNIITVCLSDNRILFFNFASDGRAELLHEMITPTLQKRVWYLPEHNVWFSAGCKANESDPYYYLNELDIEFESKNQKYTCLFNPGHHYRAHYCDKKPHRDEILDVIEIMKPMMVLTACMDGRIRLINLHEKDIVKEWTNHTLGVRSLDYNPLIESVGYVLSVGFEYYINIYCTDLSIEEAYKGRLEGHYAPVISCKFLSMSYMAASVDEEGNVRIWDTLHKLCLQLLPTPKKNFKVINLLLLTKYNKFIVFGNKMIFYDAKYLKEESKQKNQSKDENYPIKVDFNEYYQQFFITTVKDIRVYNKDGILFKCFKKLKDYEHFETDTLIKYFILENNYRKFYIGFSNGAVMQYNAGNGSLVKAINESEIEKDGIQTFKYDHCKEVTSLFYYYDLDACNYLLISSSYDSMINIYNENDPEETQKLRSIKGGHTLNHKVNEINCLDFSRKLNLFATGSTDGLVVVWDFEMTKIYDILYLPHGKIDKIMVYSLKFLDPYPILVVSYNDGTVYFWKVKKVVKDLGECLLRSRNYYKALSKIELSSIQVSQFISMEIDDIPYSVPLRKYFESNSPFMSAEVAIQYKLERQQKEDKPKIYDEFGEEQLPEEEDDDIDIVPNEYHNEKIDSRLDPERYASADKLNNYLIFGDSQGHIKILDIKGIIKTYELIAQSQVVIKSTFNLMKKDDINVETILNHTIQQNEPGPFDLFINLYQDVIRNEWKAHDAAITSMILIYEPMCFVTGSKDKLVKLWNLQCECIGVINIFPKLARNEKIIGTPSWDFIVNEKKILETEINEVFDIFERVGLEKIKDKSKEDVEAKNNIKDEVVEIIEEKKAPPKKINKRRFKPFEGEKVNTNQEDKEDDWKANMSFEGIYVQEVTRKIEKLIKKPIPKVGLNEISLNVIDTMTGKKDIPKTNAMMTFQKNKTMIKKRMTNTERRFPKFAKKALKDTFRDTLFSEKLFRKTVNDPMIIKPTLTLPYLTEDKIVFRKGETDRLLNYEFYNNSYKACCTVKGMTNIPNESLKTNYKNMWRCVNEYKKNMQLKTETSEYQEFIRTNYYTSSNETDGNHPQKKNKEDKKDKYT